MCETEVLMAVPNFFFRESFPGRELYFSMRGCPMGGASTLMGGGVKKIKTWGTFPAMGNPDI